MLKKGLFLIFSFFLLWGCSIFRTTDSGSNFLNNIYPKSWGKGKAKVLIQMQNLGKKQLRELRAKNNRLVNSYQIEDNLNEYNWHLLLESTDEELGKSQMELMRLSKNNKYSSSFMREDDFSRLFIKHIPSGEQIEFSAAAKPLHLENNLIMTMPVTAWDPYGNCLAYTNWDRANSGLYLIIADYNDSELYFEYSYFCIDQNKNYTYAQPSWSPDGRYLSCTRFKKNNSSDILIVDLVKNKKMVLDQYESLHSFEFSNFSNNEGVLAFRIAPDVYQMAVVKNLFKEPEFTIYERLISKSGLIRARISSNGKRIAAVYKDNSGIMRLQIIYNNKTLELQKEITVTGKLLVLNKHFPISPPLWLWNDNYLVFADYISVYYFFVNDMLLESSDIVKQTIKGGFDYRDIHSLNYCPVENKIIFSVNIESSNDYQSKNYFLTSKIIREPIIKTIDLIVVNSTCINIENDNITLQATGVPLSSLPPGKKIAGYAIIKDKKPVLYLDYSKITDMKPGDEFYCQWDTNIKNPQKGVKMKFEIVQLSKSKDTKIIN